MPEGPDGTAAPPVPPAASDDAPQGDLGITVALEQFSGPMDLLLYLVRKAEVDVKDLPITTIADQFAAWVEAAAGTTIDLEAAGDFVVMAATLLEIKARMVAPPPEGTVVADDGEDAFDPRAGLIRKLLVYRAAKEAAFDLDRRDDERRMRHERGHREVVPDDPAEVDAWELKDVGVGSLANLWFDLLKRLDAGGPRTVIVDDVPMGVRMAQVVEGMRQRGEGRLSELFALEIGPIARVGIVMAVLECTRQRMLRVRQAEQYGDVAISFRPEDDRAVQQGDPGPPEQLPKRHRRPPLVTWSGAPQAESDAEDGGEDEPAPVENEEQRFLRELESDIGVERLLARSGDLDKGFIDWWEETHPGEPLPPGVVKPEPPPPPPPPPVVEAKPEEPARPKRQPPRPRPAQAVEPVAEAKPGEAAPPDIVVPAGPSLDQGALGPAAFQRTGCARCRHTGGHTEGTPTSE
ncbi:MAG: segregation/condensation protein A, partial [Planctomycetes bacterium]|nr:segregation/condensation protein A [Planctomycetota bacterium]